MSQLYCNIGFTFTGHSGPLSEKSKHLHTAWLYLFLETWYKPWWSIILRFCCLQNQHHEDNVSSAANLRCSHASCDLECQPGQTGTTVLKAILFNQGTYFLCLQMNLHFYTLGAFSEWDLALETAFLFSLSKACDLIVIMSLTVNCLVLSMHLLCLPCCSFKQALLPGVCFSLLSALPSPGSLSIWLNWSI